MNRTATATATQSADDTTSPPRSALQPLTARLLTETLSTDWWRTIATLHCPASNVQIEHTQRTLIEPELAMKIRLSDWKNKIEAKLTQLREINPGKLYTVVRDPENGQEILCEEINGEFVPRMWDGKTVSPSAQLIRNPSGELTLQVHPIQYSEWTSCTNPEYAKAFREAGLPLPYAGLGISVLLETTDGFIPLTRRGIETPVYPGRLYSPGGGPKPGQSSVAALLEEILEETGLQPGRDFTAEDIIMLAYVSDTRHQGSDFERPELVAYLPLKISCRDIFDIRDGYLARKGVPETDVWAYEPVRANYNNLSGMVTLRGNEFCPPTEAALAHMIYYQSLCTEGEAPALAKLNGVMGRLRAYARDEYHPPIRQLKRD